MINRRYTILRKLGEGRSPVYLCRDRNYNREVAIKLLPSNAEKNEVVAFKDEFLLLKKISHPNILNVFDYGTVLRIDNSAKLSSEFFGSRYITSEFIEGCDLAEYSASRGIDQIDSILSQICHTLYFLHQSNFIYYDLKLENLMVQETGGMPVIKFIDFGFVQYTRKSIENSRKGTASYIAPEILQDKQIDNRADLYSLGILLYRLFAGRFPFEGKTELEVFKGHIGEEIDFSGGKIPERYIPVISRLCRKEASDRYSNALEVLADLNIQIDEEKLRKWEPVKAYVINNSVVDLKNFLLLNEPDFIKVIKGAPLSGKTSLLEEIAYNFDGVVLISTADFQPGIPQWKSFLSKILFSESIYRSLGTFLINRILKVIQEEPNNLIDELKSIFINLSQRAKFTIFFDDFNKYDPMTIQFLVQILPIFLVNRIRTVIIENEDYPTCADLIAPPIIRSLDPFTEEQVYSLLYKTFKDDFPYDEITKLIYQNCDLYPGAILSFIKDLIYLKAIRFTPKGIESDSLPEKIEVLKKNQFMFYEARLQDLGKKELEFLQYLSLFETSMNRSQIQILFDEKIDNPDSLLDLFIGKKILSEANNQVITFASSGLRDYIYGKLKNKKIKHRFIGERIVETGLEIAKTEVARQFECAGDIDSAFRITMEYVDGITKYETYRYQLAVLKKINREKLNKPQTLLLNVKLAEVYYRLGDLKSAFDLIVLILEEGAPDKETENQLLLRQGECYVGLGKIDEGVKVYKSLLESVDSKKQLLEIRYEIASAQSYGGAIAEAEEGLKKIINEGEIYPELKAKCLNLLGIIEAHYRNNVKTAVNYFKDALEIYSNEQIALKEAQVTKNIGNVYYMEGNFTDAEIYWSKSLNKNLEIGNLEEEATLLNNYGVLFFKNLDLEKAIENYKRALSIYKSLGRRFGEGLGYSNLGETYYYASEYDEALLCLDRAKLIFSEIGDIGELCEVLLLKGYLLKSVNDIPGLIKLVEEFRELSAARQLGSKELIHLSLLEIFENSSDFNTTLGKLTKIREEYLNYGEYNHFQKVTVILCEYLLTNKKINLAQDIIKSEDFVDTIQDTPYFKAYERFLSGKISYEMKDDSLKSNLEYYEEAYSILHDCSITELTWRNIGSLAEAYMDRGNINKAIEYIHLTKSLLNHISMSIKDIRLRSLYLSAPERKSTIEKLNIWESFIK